ncbi:MAG: transcriptional regulator [Nitrososphaerota archaeon]
MSRDQLIGAMMMICAIAGIAVYGWIMFFTPWYEILLKITGFIAVAGVLGIIGWIGYTLATTPPPKPIEEIEKELEKELKEMETKEEKAQS